MQGCNAHTERERDMSYKKQRREKGKKWEREKDKKQTERGEKRVKQKIRGLKMGEERGRHGAR